jgi:hypothetical protein
MRNKLIKMLKLLDNTKYFKVIYIIEQNTTKSKKCNYAN